MNIAYIPVRGGSKSVPLKNIKLMCGQPLVYWTTKAACLCKYIDAVYVTTDSNKIKETIEGFINGAEADIFTKTKVIGRSSESASDTASTEYGMLEFANDYEFDNIVLIQATSPLLLASDLDAGFELFTNDEVDSVFSVARQKRFIWDINEDGYAKPQNYDIFHRPRRQEWEGYLVENGAFYISSKENLLTYKNRISGRMKAYEMCENSVYEIDDPNDWIIIENLMKSNSTLYGVGGMCSYE